MGERAGGRREAERERGREPEAEREREKDRVVPFQLAKISRLSLT